MEPLWHTYFTVKKKSKRFFYFSLTCTFCSFVSTLVSIIPLFFYSNQADITRRSLFALLIAAFFAIGSLICFQIHRIASLECMKLLDNIFETERDIRVQQLIDSYRALPYPWQKAILLEEFPLLRDILLQQYHEDQQ